MKPCIETQRDILDGSEKPEVDGSTASTICYRSVKSEVDHPKHEMVTEKSLHMESAHSPVVRVFGGIGVEPVP